MALNSRKKTSKELRNVEESRIKGMSYMINWEQSRLLIHVIRDWHVYPTREGYWKSKTVAWIM